MMGEGAEKNEEILFLIFCKKKITKKTIKSKKRLFLTSDVSMMVHYTVVL